MQIRRGEIYLADLSLAVENRVDSLAPVLVVQNDCGNKYGQTTIVVPFSSKGGRVELPTRVEFSAIFHGSRISTFAILDHPRTLEKNRLLEHVHTLDAQTMRQIDAALVVALGLRHNQ